MSQTPHEDRERDIEERAEAIEPGSADKLVESRQAIDDAFGAAAEAASADLTDVEFNPADSGPAGAADAEHDEVRDGEAADARRASAEERAAADEERAAEADESAAQRDEAYVAGEEGMTEATAEEAGREGTSEGGVGGETGSDIGGRP